jgi:hypothetical protein
MNTPVDIYDINKFFDEMKVKGKFRPIIKNEEVRVATPLLFYLRGQSVFLMGDAGTCKTGIIEESPYYAMMSRYSTTIAQRYSGILGGPIRHF